MANISRRQIPFLPGFTIDVDGNVFYPSHKKVPTSSDKTRHGIRMLTVEIGERHWFVWELLSRVWNGNHLTLPRNGNYMQWTEANQIIVRELSSDVFKDDPEKIQFIWFLWMKGVWCWQMPDDKKIGNVEVKDLIALIRDILMVSVR